MTSVDGFEANKMGFILDQCYQAKKQNSEIELNRSQAIGLRAAIFDYVGSNPECDCQILEIKKMIENQLADMDN